MPRGKIATVLGWLVPILLLIPSIVWIALDESPIGGDPAGYGVRTLGLFHVLTGPPSEWATFVAPEQWGGLSLVRYEATPPGIVWFGQIFVMLGRWLGDIDAGLLASILATHYLTLVLLFRLFWTLSGRSTLIAILGILVVASAPLFIGLSHYYFVEPLQLLATAWFMLILAQACRWDRALVLAQLLGATTLAMLAKGSSPLYLIVPGIVALRNGLVPRTTEPHQSGYRRTTALTLAAVVPLFVVCVMWYKEHLPSVIQHISDAAYSENNAPWIGHDTFPNSFRYWVNATQGDFFPSPIVQVLALVTCAGGGAWLLIGSGSGKPARLFSLVALLQIGLAMSIFSLSSNRDDRYMLALLPYFAALIVLVMAKANKHALTCTAIAVFLLQFAHVHAQGLGVAPRSAALTVYVAPVNSDQQPRRVLESIVHRTCPGSRSAIQNVLGIQSDPVSPTAANYVVARDMTFGIRHACAYTYMGFAFFGQPLDTAWQMTLARNARYVIIRDPEIYPPDHSALNQTLDAQNLPLFIGRLENSGLFRLVGRLPEDEGILLFRRIRKP